MQITIDIPTAWCPFKPWTLPKIPAHSWRRAVMGPFLYGIRVAVAMDRDGPRTRHPTTPTTTRRNARPTCHHQPLLWQRRRMLMDSCPLPSFGRMPKSPARIACTPRLRPIAGTWSQRHRPAWPNCGTRPPGNSRKRSNKHHRHRHLQLRRMPPPATTAAATTALGRICPMLPVAAAAASGSGTPPFVPIPATSSRPVAITWRACGICARAMWCDNITVTSRPSHVWPSTTAAFKACERANQPASTQEPINRQLLVGQPWILEKSDSSTWPCAMIWTLHLAIEHNAIGRFVDTLRGSGN
jgi:hypothetical protein